MAKRSLTTASVVSPSSSANGTIEPPSKKQKTSTGLLLFTCSMLTGEPTKDKLAVLECLQHSEMQTVISLIGTCPISLSEFASVYDLLVHMSAAKNAENDIIDALFHLEHAAWELDTAKIEFDEDTKDRAIAASPKVSTRDLGFFNKALDRSPAFAPTEMRPFDTGKLVITVKQNNPRKPKDLRTKKYTFPEQSSFDTTDPTQSSLNALNTWRRTIFRTKIGTPTEANHGKNQSQSANPIPDWHPLEERWCASRYATANLYPDTTTPQHKGRPSPEYASMAGEMVDLFGGRWVPGRVALRSKGRNHGGVTSYLNRVWLMPASEKREREGWRMEVRHQVARAAIAEWRGGQVRMQMGAVGGVAEGVEWPMGKGRIVVVTREEVKGGAGVEDGMAEERYEADTDTVGSEQGAMGDEVVEEDHDDDGEATGMETEGEREHECDKDEYSFEEERAIQVEFRRYETTDSEGG